MGPSAVFSGLFVLSGSEVDRSPSFTDVNGFFIAGAMELVNSFPFAGRATTLILYARPLSELLRRE